MIARLYTNLGTCLLFLLIGTVAISCSSTKETSGTGAIVENPKESANSIENLSPSIDLTTHLSRIAGVRVRGSGPEAKITIRGNEASSFHLSTEPMFVLNGTLITSGYQQVYFMVSGSRIKRIKVLKGADAAIYGMQGSNGVIEISTQ